MEVMTFNIDNDRRNLVDDKQNFNIDFHDSKYNWLEARQYEKSMRQVEVHVVHGNGSPVDLTGMNPVFEGWLPEGVYRIIDAKHSVMIDAQNGIFRFDFPAPAFQIAGSYKQAFFRLMKDGMSVTTLEFSLDVMADKVISGLVPSDYITPFEDLYGKLQDYITKSNGDFDTAMTQWKKDVADLITNLNADVGGINLTITEIKTQLSALEDKIKADGLLTQAEFDAQIKIVNRQITDALQKLNQTIPTSSSVLIGNPVSESNQSALTNLKSGIDPSLFNLIMITDVHYGEWTTEPQKLNNTTIDHLNNVLTMDDAVDAMVMGGDNVDGWTTSLNNLLKETEKVSNKFMFESDNHSDKFILKGNHDDGAGRISQYLQGDFDYTKWMDGALDYHLTLPSLVSDQQLVEFYQSKSTLFGEKRNGSSLYFYKDYPDKKVRLIGLDSNDIPTMLKQDGSPKYLGLKNMGYQQDQINWLANDALKIPKDYVVLIIGHIPATANGDDQHNQALINQIINAYQQGTSVHAINNDTDWKVDVSADYTLQGKRLIAGYLNGHLHLEDASTTLGFNQISIASSIGNESDQNADAWDVVSIDQKNRKLILKGFGRATNRTFDY